MAKTPKELPVNFPQRLLIALLKSEACRQAGMIRQEILAELLDVLEQANEGSIRYRLIHSIQTNLKAGIAAAEKSESLWPGDDEAKELVQSLEVKESIKAKHLKAFADWDRRHKRSLNLLQESFANIRIIVERIQRELAQSRPRKETEKVPKETHPPH